MSHFRNLFFAHQAQTSPAPFIIEVERAEGVYIFDKNGKKYLDLISGISVSNVGHCAPEVVAAIQKQAAKHLHTMVYGEHIHEVSALFAEKLVKQLDNALQVVYFVNSGAEAVEGALKVAKKYTGRTEIIAFKDAYHGSTAGALSVTDSWIKEGYEALMPDVKHISFNHFTDLEQITNKTAAVIVEPIQAEAGIRLPQAGFLQAIRQKCNETGTVLIFDEIQTGFGRTGSLFFHQQVKVEPDILLTAKGLGGGMPIGAFIGKKYLMSVITNNPILGHITTFGGHPVACAAGMAALDKILNEKLLEKMPEKAAIIQQSLSHPAIKAIRGIGFMWAIELDSFENTLKVVEKAMQKGVMTDWFLNCSSALRISPPLTISQEEISEAMQILQQAIAEVYAD